MWTSSHPFRGRSADVQPWMHEVLISHPFHKEWLRRTKRPNSSAWEIGIGRYAARIQETFWGPWLQWRGKSAYCFFFFWYQRHVFNESNVRRLRVDHSAPQTPHHAFAVKRVNDFPLTGYYSNCDVLTCWGVLTINGRSSWKRNLLKTVSIMQIFEGWKSFLGKDHQMFVSFLH